MTDSNESNEPKLRFRPLLFNSQPNFLEAVFVAQDGDTFHGIRFVEEDFLQAVTGYFSTGDVSGNPPDGITPEDVPAIMARPEGDLFRDAVLLRLIENEDFQLDDVIPFFVIEDHGNPDLSDPKVAATYCLVSHDDAEDELDFDDSASPGNSVVVVTKREEIFEMAALNASAPLDRLDRNSPIDVPDHQVVPNYYREVNKFIYERDSGQRYPGREGLS